MNMKKLCVSYSIPVFVIIVICGTTEIAAKATTFVVNPDKNTEKYEFWTELSDKDPHYLTKLKDYEIIGGREVLQATDVSKKTFVTTSNGFVNAVVEAYRFHHNLIIRPDDVWLAIVMQFSNFVNANAEKLRSKFVAHEGKKNLVIQGVGSLRTLNYGRLSKKMAELMREHVKDPKVCDWILPSFSTTTDNDRIVGSVALMTAMQKYFSYEFFLGCGIPKITVMGTVEDWKDIQQRVKQLAEYGPECTKWSQMLGKILDEFVKTVSYPDDINLDFWRRICDYNSGSGVNHISGWIATFALFSEKGEWRGDNKYVNSEPGMLTINDRDIPAGYGTVDVTVDDNGTKHNCAMFVGHTGYNVTNDGTTLAPQLTWGIVLKRKKPPIDIFDYSGR